MTTTLDEAGRVMIPAAIREKVSLKPGSEVEVLAQDDGSIRLVPARSGLKLVQQRGRWKARPTATNDELPLIDFAKLVEEERDRWPW